jgi:hypothetical protein
MRGLKEAFVFASGVLAVWYLRGMGFALGAYGAVLILNQMYDIKLLFM